MKEVHFCFGSNATNQTIDIIIKNPLNAPKVKPNDWFIIWLFFDNSAMFSIFVNSLVKIMVEIKSRAKIKVVIIHSSKSTIPFILSEIGFVLDMEIRIAIIRPTNLPNSSTNPLLNPLQPRKRMNNIAKPSKNQVIYSNNSLKI